MRKTLLSISILAFLAGCASSVNVSVNSIAGPEAQSFRTFKIAPAEQTVDENDLTFQAYAAQVEEALVSKGFTRPVFGLPPQVLILLAYGVGDPQAITTTSAIPQWGQTGVSSSNSYGTINQYGNYSATTTYTPTYGVTGYMPVTSTTVIYSRVLSLSAYDFFSTLGGKPRQIWKTRAVSVGSSGDLRYIFPYLLRAAQPYLGEDSKVVQSVSFSAE